MKNIKLQPLIIGLLIIAAGALLVAFNSGMLPMEYKRIVFSWPMLLVAVGFSAFFGGAKSIFGGVALVVAGGLFLLRRMGVAAGYLNGENLWAALLVAAGVLIVLKACVLKKRHGKCSDRATCCRARGEADLRTLKDELNELTDGINHRADSRPRGGHTNRSFSDVLERSYVFGGAREKVESQNFSGGEISCVFGGTVLDFSAAQLAEGVSHLEINTVFGGVELYMPNDWSVELRQTCIFGGFVDRRSKAVFDVADNRRLVLEVTSVFGGGEIKNGTMQPSDASL